MSHPGSVDIIDFVLLTIYPVGALFIIEIISRVVNRAKQIIPSWIKLYVQGITMIGFAFAYTVFISLITTSSDEHILAELGPVARLFPELAVDQLWCLDFLIAIIAQA